MKISGRKLCNKTFSCYAHYSKVKRFAKKFANRRRLNREV